MLSGLSDLVVRLISDVGMLQEVAVTALLPMLAKGLVVAGMIGLMFWMNWRLAVIAVAVFPLFWLRTISLSKRTSVCTVTSATSSKWPECGSTTPVTHLSTMAWSSVYAN